MRHAQSVSLQWFLFLKAPLCIITAINFFQKLWGWISFHRDCFQTYRNCFFSHRRSFFLNFTRSLSHLPCSLSHLACFFSHRRCFFSVHRCSFLDSPCSFSHRRCFFSPLCFSDSNFTGFICHSHNFEFHHCFFFLNLRFYNFRITCSVFWSLWIPAINSELTQDVFKRKIQKGYAKPYFKSSIRLVSLKFFFRLKHYIISSKNIFVFIMFLF